MFGLFNHLFGAVTVRIHRYLIKIKNSADVSSINSNLTVGGANNIECLVKKNIQSIIDLRDESSDDITQIKNFNMHYLRVPIKDRGTPTIKEVSQIVNWINNEIDQKRIVFIHCNLGRGRGPLLTILYLITKGMTSKSAIEKVKNIRSFTFLNQNQLNFIKKFEITLHQNND